MSSLPLCRLYSVGIVFRAKFLHSMSAMPWYCPPPLLLAAFLPILLIRECTAHPQCLDFGAPFEVTASNETFCPQYAQFGCCTAERDAKAKESFEKLRVSVDSKCSQLMKQVLCLKCHPYAAHIFTVEGGSEPMDANTATPGFCPGFCETLFRECPRQVIKRLVRQSEWSPSSEHGKLTAKAVCSRLQSNDTDYCSPNVDTIDNRNLSRRYNYEKNKECLCVREVARNLRNPLAAVHAGDGTNRLFIAEQPGVVRILDVRTGRLLPQPFFDIKQMVLTSSRAGDERGLLSIAFHPNYGRNGRFFAYYSSKARRVPKPDKVKPSRLSPWGVEHKSVLSEFKVSRANPNRLNPRREKVILEITQPRGNHNGGNILFGEDGYLYLTLGDGGGAGDRFGRIGNGLNRLVV